MPSLILSSGHTGLGCTNDGVLHSSPASPLAPPCNPDGTQAGQGCSSVWGEQCHQGSQDTSQHQAWTSALAVSQWEKRMQHPCLPAWHVGEQGTLVWPKHTAVWHRHGSKNQDHTKGWIVRTIPSMVADHACKSSRERMPLWSVFVKFAGPATVMV